MTQTCVGDGKLKWQVLSYRICQLKLSIMTSLCQNVLVSFLGTCHVVHLYVSDGGFHGERKSYVAYHKSKSKSINLCTLGVATRKSWEPLVVRMKNKSLREKVQTLPTFSPLEPHQRGGYWTVCFGGWEQLSTAVKKLIYLNKYFLWGLIALSIKLYGHTTNQNRFIDRKHSCEMLSQSGMCFMLYGASLSRSELTCWCGLFQYRGSVR